MRTLLKKIYAMIFNFLPHEAEDKIANDAGEYWVGSQSSENKRDLSHWRGRGRWTDDKWREIGEHHFKLFEKLCSVSCIPKENIQTILEWGPGGGSNAVRFSQHVSVFYGVDISQPNLHESARQLANTSFNGFKPILIAPGDPSACISKINCQLDFFLSTAVFQHFPSKNYGFKVLEIAHKLLKPGAVALVQIRYDNLKYRYRPKWRDYKYNAITFTSYKLDEFWKMCIETKFMPLFISLEPEVNYAYYFLKNSEK